MADPRPVTQQHATVSRSTTPTLGSPAADAGPPPGGKPSLRAAEAQSPAGQPAPQGPGRWGRPGTGIPSSPHFRRTDPQVLAHLVGARKRAGSPQLQPGGAAAGGSGTPKARQKEPSTFRLSAEYMARHPHIYGSPAGRSDASSRGGVPDNPVRGAQSRAGGGGPRQERGGQAQAR